MSAIAIGLNLLLATLLATALFVGWRLNRRLNALRDSNEDFAKAVSELNTAARRAEQGLAALRAATDEAHETLADRIENARALSVRLERLMAQAPQAAPAPARAEDELTLDIEKRSESRLGALLGAARAVRARPAPEPAPRRAALAPRPSSAEDDLFDEPADLVLGARR
jgi:ABC-type transporter Mla subunit MlaD